MLEEDQFITVNVTSPFNTPASARIDKYAPIVSFVKNLDIHRPVCVIYNGQTLIPQLSLNFYGITEGSQIVIVPSIAVSKLSGSKKRVKKFIIPSPDITDTMNHFQTVFQSNAHLRDLFFRKVEGTIRCHRKIVERFKSIVNHEEDEEVETSVITSHVDHPSTCSLPFVWEKEEEDS